MEHTPNLVLRVELGHVSVESAELPFTSAVLDYLSDNCAFEQFIDETYPFMIGTLAVEEESIYLVYLYALVDMDNYVDEFGYKMSEMSLLVEESEYTEIY